MFADIRVPNNGFPKVLFEGYTYGRKKRYGNQDCLYWSCTGSSLNNKRCLSTIETKTVGGYEMLRVKQPRHTCIRKKIY